MKIAFFSLLLMGVLAQISHATPVPASRADDFVDSIGVCTHWGYYDTPYGNFERASVLLGELGIRHIRDGLHPHERELFDRYGIKTTAGFVPQSGDLKAQLQAIKENRDILDAIEGPNEVDLFANNAKYKGEVFPEGARLYQNDLYAAVKGDAATASLPVVALSTGRAGSNVQLAPLNSFDYRVMHSYAGGQKPSDSLEGEVYNNIRNSARLQGSSAVLKPIVVTESGYHNALGANMTLGGVQPGIDEATGAKYFPRHFAEYFNAGIQRTFTYEFLNEFADEQTNAEANFGLVHRDFTPKPAYTALKNLIASLSEAKWNTATKQWDKPNPNFSPRALDFDLDGDSRDVHSTLLQKADGDFYLLLWREVPSFDTKTQKAIDSPPAKVVIRVPAPTLVTGFRLSDNQPFTLTPVMSRIFRVGQLRFAVNVPDEVVVLKISPKAPLIDTTPPAPPSGLRVQPLGNTMIALTWPSPSDKDTAGYFVSRLGQEIGIKGMMTPMTGGIDMMGLMLIDDKLDPATGYTYSVRAYDKAGNISKPAIIVGMTKNEMPDLVITRLTLVAGEYQVGTDAHFEATIENRGNAATPTGVTHGVAFSVDGEFLAWSDTFQGPLAPGASVVVRSNSGPKGTATWRVAAGKHTLHAQVDDVNRINESNENDNVLDVTIEK